MANQSLVAIPPNVEEPIVLKRFLSRLVEQLDIVLGNRAGPQNKYADQQQLVSLNEQLTTNLKSALESLEYAILQTSELTDDEVIELTKRVLVVEDVNSQQNTRLNDIELLDGQQDTRLDDIELLDGQQDTRLDDIESLDGQQDTRLDDIELLDGQQDTRLDDIELLDGQQDTRLDDIELLDGQQNTRLNDIESLDGQQDTRLDDIELLDGQQDIRLDELDAEKALLAGSPAQAFSASTQTSTNFKVANDGGYSTDTSANAIAIASAGTKVFSNFSGMIIVNNTATGGVGLFLVGAGANLTVASVGSSVGSFSYVAPNYVWTSNDASTSNYTFTLFRTRSTA
jgi:hypothetical protein